MMMFDRTKKSFVHQWWFDIDRVLLTLAVSFFIIGLMLVLTASPYVAMRLDLEPYYFIKRQSINVSIAIAVMLLLSTLSRRYIMIFCVAVFILCIGLLLAVLGFGTTIKGARRWIYILGISVQPSEIAKVLLPLTTAWIAVFFRNASSWIRLLTFCVPYSIVTLLVMMQPDFGMVFLNTAVFIIQFFLAGISLLWIGMLIGLGSILALVAYNVFPHVAYRVNTFLDESLGYQIQRSLESFQNGGFFGTGPGHGIIKEILPDAHTDFIFATLGEEFGVFGIICVLLLYGYFFYRISSHIYRQHDAFLMIGLSGVMVMIGLQFVIHAGSNLRLLPTKGMTLPFISYGGTATIAMGIALGCILALTRHSMRETRPND